MRIRHRATSPNRESIARDPTSSFAAFRSRRASFPFVWHYHPEIELTYIVRGAGLRFLGDSIEAFGPGDLILIGENVPHTWQSTGAESQTNSDQVESIVLQFDGRLLGDAMDKLPELQPIRRALEASARGLSVQDPALRDRVRQQMENLLDAPVGSAERLLHLIGALQSVADGFGKNKRLLRFVSTSPRNDSRSSDVATNQLERVLQSLHASLDSGDLLTQAAAARLVRMSPASFSRFFRRKVGRTFAHYVNEWRVELACRALVQTSRSITEIAFGCGFENLSNFNRRFRFLKGMTPREFRRLQ